MLASPTVVLDLPLKLLVGADVAARRTSCNMAEYLQTRHGCPRSSHEHWLLWKRRRRRERRNAGRPRCFELHRVAFLPVAVVAPLSARVSSGSQRLQRASGIRCAQALDYRMRHAMPELLAPAGSLDAARAAIANGADAIYLGVEKFNARDDGAQLTFSELEEACRIAHARHVRVYLTLNVLVKPAELEDVLMHLGRCVDAGIDAALVQDVGLIALIREVFPGLEIHGSTQLTIHDAAGARLLQEMGLSRLVVARENTLDDIRAIHAAVPTVELESFVHGALCIAYSGQCFMSGMISERSANRGACAQSCRKEYVLTDATSSAVLDRGYLISAKDLAAWAHLAAIAEAGVRCLKIEGRKKKPEYVATVTRGYRSFLNDLAAGIWKPDVTPARTEPLVQIFSRGFTGGMYRGRVGREYITRSHPDNRGLVLGRVTGRSGNDLLVSVSQPLNRGDGVGFEHPDGPTRGNTGFAITRIRTVRADRGLVIQAIGASAPVPVGWVVVRSSQASLLEGARGSFARLVEAGTAERERLDVSASGANGTPLTLRWTGRAGTVSVASEILLSPATQHALDATTLRRQLERLGTTPFVLGTLDVGALRPDLFLPMSALNDVRQQAVTALLALEEGVARERTLARRASVSVALGALPRTPPVERTPVLAVDVWRLDDAYRAAEAGATELSLDLFLRHPMPAVTRVRSLLEAMSERGIPVRLRLPTIARPADRRLLEKWLGLDTALITGHLGLVAEFARQRDVVADYGVNCFNPFTAAELFRLGAQRVVLSVELTGAEMGQVAAPQQGQGFEVFAYGRPEGMTLEHCVLSAAFDRGPYTCRDLCVRKHPHIELKDSAGYAFPVATDYACRNRLLHSRPVSAARYLPALWRAGIRTYRLVFNVPGDPIVERTRAFRRVIDELAGGRTPNPSLIREAQGETFTRGHFARAV
jgi:U32 family peptidase